MYYMSLNRCLLVVFTAAALLAGCGPTLRGMVVLPDGSPLQNTNVVVYTNPWTDSVKVREDGSFKLGKGVQEAGTYTVIAEDNDGNMGYVKGYQLTEKNKSENIVIRMSREMDAKEAVIEGDIYIQQDSGPGEKILKSSQ